MVALVAKRVSCLTAFPPPPVIPPPKRGQTGEAAHVGVLAHTGVRADVKQGEGESGKRGASMETTLARNL